MMDKPAPIDSFQGKYRFLSNFWYLPVEFEGVIYPTLEHAYQAAKVTRKDRPQILACPTPVDAKRLGRKLMMTPGWDNSKIEVMRLLLQRKFKDPVAQQLLLETGEAELIEGNWWGDTFWGVCRGKGKNVLGQLLMETRDGIRREI
jgi:ribA/ribD-fused uncharacterized protein